MSIGTLKYKQRRRLELRQTLKWSLKNSQEMQHRIRKPTAITFTTHRFNVNFICISNRNVTLFLYLPCSSRQKGKRRLLALYTKPSIKKEKEDKVEHQLITLITPWILRKVSATHYQPISYYFQLYHHFLYFKKFNNEHELDTKNSSQIK